MTPVTVGFECQTKDFNFYPQFKGIQILVCLFIHVISGISNVNKADHQEDSFDIMCRMGWIG